MLRDMTREHRAEPEPRWLTSAQQRAWRELTFLMAHLPATLEAQLKRDAGLSYLEYYVMAGLSGMPDHAMRLSDLARLVNSELSRLSHLVSRLEQRGFMKRLIDCTDGRYTKAVLTDAGYAHLVEVAPAHVTEVEKLVFDVLDDADVEALRRCTEKINQRLAAGNSRLEA
jgi:DNA-binding MarR family transcriptional regulator